MKNAYDTCITLIRVEEACCIMRKLLTDGSYLSGHTVKQYDKIDMHAVRVQLGLLSAAVETLEEKVAE